MSQLEKYKLKVVGEQTLYCSGCENSVQRGLSLLPGVKRVKADHETQRIEIASDMTQTNLESILERLELMGYGVVLEV